MKIIAIRWGLTAVFCAFLLGFTLQWFTHRTIDNHNFDPNEVARLETLMWRSYYDKKPVQLYWQLMQLMREVYHIPLFVSGVASYYGTKAAFIFKYSHTRDEYQRALPDLINFYATIGDLSNKSFNAKQAAKLELEWWIIHRERERYSEQELVLALAGLQAAIYHVPVSALLQHARLRADAMLLRDERANHVTDKDWAKIQALLQVSWQSLWQIVNSNNATASQKFSVSSETPQTASLTL